MNKIELKFSVTHSFLPSNGMVVIMTLDEKEKKYKVKLDDELYDKMKVPPHIPKRVLAAFTENSINKILSKDEIPNESCMMVLDGYSYDITITKGNVRKEYYANDVTVETYPLLRYLASWCRRKYTL